MGLLFNTTCDIYRVGNAPPSAPDVAGVPCFLTNCFDLGRERGEKEAQQFRFTSILRMPPTSDVRDNFNNWGGTASNRDMVYIPDLNGIGYLVNFVERVQRGTPSDHLRVYLDRKSVSWPYPASSGGGGGGPIPPAHSVDSTGDNLLTFNGSIPTAPPYSMSLWARGITIPGNMGVFWQNYGGSGVCWRMEVNSGNQAGHFQWGLGDPAGSPTSWLFCSAATVDDGNWHNVIFCYDGTTVTCYIDGVLDAGITPAGSLNSFFHQIEWDYSRITEVRVYNRVLTASDAGHLFNLMNVTSGLVAYWPFREGSGTTVADILGGNNGTLAEANWDTDFPS